VSGEPLAALPASTALTMGSRKASDFLEQSAAGSDDRSEQAAATLFRAVGPGNARALHEALFRGNQSRTSVKAAGSAGTPDLVPFLLECLGEAGLTRATGDALRAITGLDLTQPGLTASAGAPDSGPNEDPKDENVDIDPDARLPYPDPTAVRAWWSSHAQEFRPQTRYLAGVAVTDNSLNLLLKSGPQSFRSAAAELAALRGRPWFDVSAPAFRQQQRLAHEAVWR